MTTPAWEIQAGGWSAGPTVSVSGFGTGFVWRP